MAPLKEKYFCFNEAFDTALERCVAESGAHLASHDKIEESFKVCCRCS